MRFLLLPLTAALAAVLAPALAQAAGPRTVVAGTFSLPAAQAFGEPGFHQVLVAGRRAPRRLPASAGAKIVLTLRDVSRPGATCKFEHPLSGCATVDWSDDPGRPKVPASGVFRNAVVVRLASGPRTYFLHEIGTLSGKPEAFQPG